MCSVWCSVFSHSSLTAVLVCHRTRPAALGGVPWFQLPGAQPVSGAMDAHARSWFDAMQARARAQSGAGVGNTDVAGAGVRLCNILRRSRRAESDALEARRDAERTLRDIQAKVDAARRRAFHERAVEVED